MCQLTYNVTELQMDTCLWIGISKVPRPFHDARLHEGEKEQRRHETDVLLPVRLH